MTFETKILSPELPVGYKLRDIYTITDVIGQGGFGITYQATEDVTGRNVVIKENFPAEFSMRDYTNHHAGPAGATRKESYDWALGSFLNEAKILTRLKHPNIVPVLTAFKTLGTAYYVMDYIGGQPLHRAVPPRVTEEWLLGILRPMLSALHYIHTLPQGQLLHRDVKPNNILITPEGTPILIDFGAARSMISTYTHSKVGTPGYAPHEQWSSSKKCGPWTDIYALGATCYYLIVGEAPPDCSDRMPDETYRPLAPRPELRGRFSHELLASIDKALALRTTDRWQSAQEWQAAITPGINREAAQAELQKWGIAPEEYNTKLLVAAGANNPDLLRMLTTAGVDVNITDNQSETPLFLAVKSDYIECVKLLLSVPGIEVNKANHYGWTPLFYAAWAGHTDCLQALLKVPGIDINKATGYGWTPLNGAAEKGHPDCVRALLAMPGIDVNKANHESWTPLYWAAYAGHVDCVRELLTAPGIDINKATDYGWAPLNGAAEKGHADCVRALLAMPGIDVNKANDYGWTSLYWATYAGHVDCVRELLKAPGIDVNKSVEHGWTPLFYAAWAGHTDCLQALLTAPGIDINRATDHGWTPLNGAAEKGHPDCVRALLSMPGIDVNKANHEGWTPLYWAAAAGHVDCVRALLSAPGINVNQPNNHGQTPLAATGNEEIKQLLRQAGGR